MSSLLASEDIAVNLRSRDGSTALFAAAFRGHERAVQLLLQHPKINVNLDNRKQRTPLHAAAENGKDSVVEMMLLRTDIL